MADTSNYLERGISMQKGVVFSFQRIANAAISPGLLLDIDSSGEVGPAAASSNRVIGASSIMAPAYADGDTVDVLWGGEVILTANDGGIVAGYPLKSAAAGTATALVDSTLAGTTLDTSSAGIAFGNQPANDGVEVLSSSAADTTQTATVYGTTNGTDTVVVEEIALTGTTPAASVKTDWGVILAVSLDAACAGTFTIQEASGGADITTMTTGVLSKGLDAVTGTTVYAFNVAPTLTGSDTTTKQVGLIGTNSAGTTIYDSQALNNTTAVTMNSAFNTVTYFLTGDLEATRTAVLKVGAEEDDDLKVGRAIENQTVTGDTFRAILIP